MFGISVSQLGSIIAIMIHLLRTYGVYHSPVIHIPDETPGLEATESEDLTYIEPEGNHFLLLKSTLRNTFELVLIFNSLIICSLIGSSPTASCIFRPTSKYVQWMYK